VIWNLLDNAVKFSRRGGVVTIRLAGAPDGVELSVQDEGRGISPEFLPHIFERFRQEDAGTTRWYGGLGLGLSIVKELVEAHGSVVAATSDGPDRGTTFAVRIPQSDVRPAESAHAAEARQPTLEGVRILIVEDDEDARGLLNRVLSSAEARVCEVEDVRGALDALESFQPNLVVSDIGIPGEDGYDLIRQIRARGFDAARLPAIALTAYARIEDQERALEAGYQRHLSKPLDVGQLVRAATSLTRNGSGDRRP